MGIGCGKMCVSPVQVAEMISGGLGIKQWRIQEFPEGGAPTAKVGAPTYYFCQFSPKTA